MPETKNPFTPGQPVDDPKLFFGRREVLASIRDQLAKGQRVFTVAGARRLGKTSLLRQVTSALPEGFFPVLVGLQEENPQHLDWLLWRLALAIARQAGPRLGMETTEPAWPDFESHTERFLDRFWPVVRSQLGDRSLMLLLDDLGSLTGHGPGLLDPFLAVLTEWRSQDPDVALILTMSGEMQDRLAEAHPRLFGGALSFVLGPLSSEEAIRLITWPVDGVLSYDYGIPRRLVEITSGQPHYLHLLCSEILNRCAATGWVNQRDVDLVMQDLVSRDLAEFRQIWDESSPQEQAALAALVSLRGARGVATAREVQEALIKAGARIAPGQVKEALDRLAAREILERLGALSYRFRVGLLRDWLDKRLDLHEVVRTTRWATAARGKAPAEASVGRLQAQQSRRTERKPPPAEPAEASDTSPQQPGPRRISRIRTAAAAVLGLVAVAVIGFALARPVPVARPGSPTPPGSATAPATKPASPAMPSSTPRLPATRPPTASPLPRPSATPSPTAPIIVARPVPSIAYLSKAGKEMPWTIYLMNSDGGNRIPLIEASADFISAPSWSPDGLRLAFVSDKEGNDDVWVVDIDGRNPANLTHSKAREQSPAWSPDGEWIAFSSVRDSVHWQLYVMRAVGSDVQRLTWWEDASDLSPSWSPDGIRLAFASMRDGNWEIYTIGRDGSGLTRLTDDPASDTNPAWSPDGSRIAFQSDRAGYTDVFVMPAEGGAAVNLTRLSSATDLGPTWSPDGGRIAFYSDRDGNWGIFAMGADGGNVVKLTGESTRNELPAWRP